MFGMGHGWVRFSNHSTPLTPTKHCSSATKSIEIPLVLFALESGSSDAYGVLMLISQVGPG